METRGRKMGTRALNGSSGHRIKIHFGGQDVGGNAILPCGKRAQYKQLSPDWKMVNCLGCLSSKEKVIHGAH